MQVWVNGEFCDRNEAKVSVFDAGYQHAVGLFETMAARNGRVFRAAAHMNRLIGSASELLLTQRLRDEPLIEAMHSVVQRNELEEARVRLSVTGGDLGAPMQQRQQSVDPTIVIAAQPPTLYPDEFFQQGVLVTIADGRLNPLDPMAGHKTLNYWPKVYALQMAATRNASESLWFTVTNHLASGSVSNVFAVRDGVLRTPIARGEEEEGAMTAPVLPGITRALIMELAAEDGLEVQRTMIDIDELLKAQEVFLTNSSWGVLPVVQIEQEKIGEGAVGPTTRRLRERWKATVDEETAADAQLG